MLKEKQKRKISTRFLLILWVLPMRTITTINNRGKIFSRYLNQIKRIINLRQSATQNSTYALTFTQVPSLGPLYSTDATQFYSIS